MKDGFTEEELRVLSKLIEEDRLIATIDVTGKPFHRITCMTSHTRRRDKLILWLGDDLETPMADESDRIRCDPSHHYG